MPNAQTKAASGGEKKERKKPVRTAPKQSDFPSKTAYFEAMLEHERKQQAEASRAKAARLDKRIGSVKGQIADLTAKYEKLVAEREALVSSEGEGETPES